MELLIMLCLPLTIMGFVLLVLIIADLVVSKDYFLSELYDTRWFKFK